MTTNATTTYVPRITAYGNFSARTLNITEALAYCEDPAREVGLMLGAMQPGYLGREVVSEDDLRRWEHEADEAAAWAAIEAGERYAAENGLLR